MDRDEQYPHHSYSYEPFFNTSYTDAYPAFFSPRESENSLALNNDIPPTPLVHGGARYNFGAAQQGYRREEPCDGIYNRGGQENDRDVSPVAVGATSRLAGGVRAGVFGLERGFHRGVTPHSIHLYFLLVAKPSSPAFAWYERVVSASSLYLNEVDRGFFTISVTSAFATTVGTSLPDFFLRAMDDQRTILATVRVLPAPYENIESLFGYRLLGSSYQCVADSMTFLSAVGGSESCKFILVLINPYLVAQMNSESASIGSNTAQDLVGGFLVDRGVDPPSIDYSARIADNAQLANFSFNVLNSGDSSSWPYPPLPARRANERQTRHDEQSFENCYLPHSAAQMLSSESYPSFSDPFPPFALSQTFTSTEAMQAPGPSSAVSLPYTPQVVSPRPINTVLKDACAFFLIPLPHGTLVEKKGKGRSFPSLVQDWYHLTELLHRLGYDENKGPDVQHYSWEHGGSATFEGIIRALNWTLRDFKQKTERYNWASVAAKTKMWDPEDATIRARQPRQNASKFSNFVIPTTLKSPLQAWQENTNIYYNDFQVVAAKGRRTVKPKIIDPFHTWKRIEYFFNNTRLAFEGGINVNSPDDREKDLLLLRDEHIKAFKETIITHLVDRQ
ncbi:hypothetical protein EV360DRAFT_73075 [Lentinula raphanica]|nr:hypothetical protein EV360DRAFT_73075 [Lentinula raphanica]